MQQTDHSNKKVWAIMHATHEDMGSIEFILRSMRIHPVPMLAGHTDIEALDPAEADLVLVMGGPMGVYEADRHPHLHHETRFLERRIAIGKPTLGICLGSQLIAKALGSNVYKGQAGKEIGWHDITLTPEGAASPLRHFDPAQGPIMQWHGDTFDLPEGAVRLASSTRYQNQAFAYGAHTLALQFHPEVTELKLERWYEKAPHDMAEVGTNAEAIRQAAQIHGDALKHRNRRFLTEWLGQVAPQLLPNP